MKKKPPRTKKRSSSPPKRPKKRAPVGGRSTAAPRAAAGEGERLQKVLAAAGVASRRECELLIAEGRVEVDGDVVQELGVRVDPAKQKIFVDGELLPQKKRVYFAVNKPEGVVSTARDPSGRTRVIDLIPPDAGRLFNVGRLDMASEGLILVTNDGELANQLTHPRHGVEKTYHVQVQGQPTRETLATLRNGVRLAEGKAHFVHAKVKSKKKNSTVLEVVLDEGRNREIRRVLARVGHKVQRLTRIAVGPVRLGELPAGAYRELTPKEIKALREAASGVPSGEKRKTKKPRKPAAAKAKQATGSRSPAAGQKKKAAAKKSTGRKKSAAKKAAVKKTAAKKAAPNKPKRKLIGSD